MSTAYQTVSRVANETYGHSRRIMPNQPWWDNLESSFHKFPASCWSGGGNGI